MKHVILVVTIASWAGRYRDKPIYTRIFQTFKSFCACVRSAPPCFSSHKFTLKTRPQADGPKNRLIEEQLLKEGDVFQTPNKNKGDNVWLFFPLIHTSNEVEAASGTGDPTRLATLKVGSSSHYLQGFRPLSC